MDKNKSAINIVIVALNEKFSKNVASSLAEKLDMFVSDCHDLIVYDLVNPKEVLDKCGLEYFKKRESGVIKNCSEYYNTVLTINYDLFKEYHPVFDKSLIIYLRLPEMKITKNANKLDFDNRDKFLIENSNIIIKSDKLLVNRTVKNIIQRLGEIL